MPTPLGQVLRSAAAAVAPGGTLLIVGHAGFASRQTPDPQIHFPTPQEVLDDLALPPGQWTVRRSEVVKRQHSGPDGQPGTRLDSVLRVDRL